MKGEVTPNPAALIGDQQTTEPAKGIHHHKHAYEIVAKNPPKNMITMVKDPPIVHNLCLEPLTSNYAQWHWLYVIIFTIYPAFFYVMTSPACPHIINLPTRMGSQPQNGGLNHELVSWDTSKCRYRPECAWLQRIQRVCVCGGVIIIYTWLSRLWFMK